MVTPRLHAAIDQLCGAGRTEPFGCGWWVVSFPGLAEPPWEANGNWHVDGYHYTHYPDSREIGLLPIFIFNDLGPGDGGTALCEGSHVKVIPCTPFEKHMHQHTYFGFFTAALLSS